MNEAAARVARREIAAAIAALSAPDADWRTAIHEARQRFKNLRALFRLVRSADKSLFDSESRRYRDLGRLLASQREVGAMVETLARARKNRSARGMRATIDAVHDRLLERERSAQEAQDEVGETLALAIGGCRDGLRALNDLDLPSSPARAARVIERGVRRDYRLGREALERARMDRRPEDFHKLRQATKRHWFHLRMLQPAWPGPIRARRRAARRLGSTLGDLNDLAVMLQKLMDDPDGFGSVEDAEALAGLLHRQRLGLERKALNAAARLYAETPRALSARLAAYCRQANAETGRPSHERTAAAAVIDFAAGEEPAD